MENNIPKTLQKYQEAVDNMSPEELALRFENAKLRGKLKEAEYLIEELSKFVSDHITFSRLMNRVAEFKNE